MDPSCWGKIHQNKMNRKYRKENWDQGTKKTNFQ